MKLWSYLLSALWVFSVLVWPVASEPPTRRPPALRGLELVRQAQLWWSVNDDKLRLRFRSGLLTTDIFIQRQFTGAIRGGSMPTNVLYNFIFDPLREELADNNHRNMWDYYRGSYTRFFHGENTGDIDFRVIVLPAFGEVDLFDEYVDSFAEYLGRGQRIRVERTRVADAFLDIS